MRKKVAKPRLYIAEWREARQIKQRELAEAIGRDPSIVSKIEAGRIGVDSEGLQRIAAALRIAPGDLYASPPPATPPLAVASPTPGSTVTPPPSEHAEALAAAASASMPPDLPVLGTAAGSVSGAIQIGGVVDYVRRPPALGGARDVYAIYVRGDSMDPEHKDGALCFVHPHRPARPGDCVIIQIDNGNGDPAQSYIKRLVRRTDKWLEVEQLNPPAQIRFATKHVVAIHKVLTMADLFGL